MSSTAAKMKVVLLGGNNVGKSTLMERFLSGKYLSNPEVTIGNNSCQKAVQTQTSDRIVLVVWDTAGIEPFDSVTRLAYRGAAAVILCYDVANPDTLGRAKFWAKEVTRDEPRCHLYVCGCKVDLAAAEISQSACHQVTPSDVEQFANSISAPFVETSSKTGKNVTELFATIAEDFARDMKQQQQQLGNIIIARESDSASPGQVVDERPAAGDMKPTQQRKRCLLS